MHNINLLLVRQLVIPQLLVRSDNMLRLKDALVLLELDLSFLTVQTSIEPLDQACLVVSIFLCCVLLLLFFSKSLLKLPSSELADLNTIFLHLFNRQVLLLELVSANVIIFFFWTEQERQGRSFGPIQAFLFKVECSRGNLCIKYWFYRIKSVAQ